MQVLWPGTTSLALGQQPRLKHTAYAKLQPGDREFLLPDLWSLLVFHYSMAAEIDGRSVHIEPGYLLLMPPGGHKHYHQRERNSRHVVFHFSLPPGRPTDPQLPALVDLAGSYAATSDRLLTAVGWAATDLQRSEIRLWDLLHELADLAPAQAATPSVPPLVLQAQRAMERRLSDAPSLARIAAELGCSHGHLCAIFRRHTGVTPGAWMRQRRIAHAEHLLRHSALTIRDIAAEVGVPDLQHFNKMVRRVFGCGPRALRERR